MQIMSLHVIPFAHLKNKYGYLGCWQTWDREVYFGMEDLLLDKPTQEAAAQFHLIH